MAKIMNSAVNFFSRILYVVKDAAKAFFDINKEDDIKEGSKKVATTAVRRVVYVAADYWASLACAGIVGLLNYWQWPFWNIVIATWLFDFAIAYFFMIASEKSGHDITFGESFRRATNVIHSNHRLSGYVAIVYLNVKAVIWDGPEQVVIFFKKELTNLFNMTMALVALTLIQGIFWAWVYSLGYDSVSELIKHFFS